MKILFQGDSITDAGRDYDNVHDLGNGYVSNAVEKITAAFPSLSFEFINLGICGNRSIDLVERLQRDFIDVQPDIVSILIGINDVWHRHTHKHPMSDEQFEANYRQVLERIRKETNAKILIMAPFLLPAEDKEEWRGEVDSVAGVVCRLAKEYADGYLPLDELFATLPSAAEYARDGVHPNDKGVEFIGSRYLEAITPLIREIANK